jgi:alkanesulfonate monooxygenase SsuD/methylene tetrahydromethanopterin reductase-like flavin-dependent oxidoreductase (luciferase family)
VKVGLVLPQAPEDGPGGTWAGIRGLANQAEEGGADSLWICDHFLFRRSAGSQTGFHEGWSLLAALAVATDRVELGTLVLAAGFRPPGLLAKMAATTDEVADGRLIIGLGCGWHEPEYLAFGYPFDHRVSRLEETLRIVVPLLRGESVTFQGEWNAVNDAIVLPPPTRRIPVLIAAEQPRMLGLTARFADAWQTAWYGRPDARFSNERAGLVAACEAEGRDPASLELTVGIDVRDAGGGRGTSLGLDSSEIADGLGAWVAEGVGHVQLSISPKTPETFDAALEGIRRFREG